MIGSGTHPTPENLYFHIAADSALAASSEKDEFRRKQLVVTSFLFSALTAEAFINQQYHRLRAGDMRQMSLIRKWTSLSERLGFPESPIDQHPAIGVLRELIDLRNGRLVHFKPDQETRSEGGQYNEPSLNSLFDNPSKASDYVQAVRECIELLHRATHGATELPEFLRGVRYVARVWASSNSAMENLGPAGL